MYTTSSIAPVFVIHRLSAAGLLGEGTKVLLVSSESGSITLRHPSEGGGNYAHHASKAALNMVGKLLSLDLKDKGTVVSIAHPGFMRTEMTKSVGFDKYWDEGGGELPLERARCREWVVLTIILAVTPDEAAKGLIEWTDRLDMSKTGEFWAPRGPGECPS
jgi:NAD(P)-dependent dehydrogenase (short-subunit alcohol dehydrogenase family)